MAVAIARDATSFQSNGSKNADHAATEAAKARGGFWGPWRPNGSDTGAQPSPAPAPAPSPAPSPVPTPEVHLTYRNFANPTPSLCLRASALQKASLVHLGACDDNSKWSDVAHGARLADPSAKQGANFLRQSPKANCTVGNTVQLGVDGESGEIKTQLTLGGTLRETGCGADDLCIGYGVKGRLALVKCTDSLATGWVASAV